MLGVGGTHLTFGGGREGREGREGKGRDGKGRKGREGKGKHVVLEV